MSRHSKPFGTASTFGATGFDTIAPTGTTRNFNPPTGTDTKMIEGLSTRIGTRFQCITCMKEYENKSLEELRVEDYAANRKGGFSTSVMETGALSQQTRVLGAPAASTSAFSFGGNQSKPLFGLTGTKKTFGSGSLFGTPAQTQNNGQYGEPAGHSTPVAPVFNFIFDQNNQLREIRVEDYAANHQRGSTTGAMGFGTHAQQASILGAPEASTFAFSFGGNHSKPCFGTTGTKNTFDSVGSFGQPAQTQNNGLHGDLTGLATPVAPAFNFIFGQNNQLKELSVEDYAASRQGGRKTGGMGFGTRAQQASVLGAPAASTSAFSFGGNQSKPFFGTTGTKRGLFRQPAQTQNNGLYGDLPGLAKPVAPAFNFSFGQNNKGKKLREGDYAGNRQGGSTTGAMGFGTHAQQASILGAPAASTSAFTFGGNQSKPFFGTTGKENTFDSGSLFGIPAQAQKTGLYGEPAGFGTPATSAPPGFNFGSTSLFGQNNHRKNTGLYGEPAGFGSSAVSANPFSNFGSTFVFGQNNHQNELRVGNSAANRKGGSTTGVTGFGDLAQKTSIFGAPAVSTSAFHFGRNQSTSLFGTTGMKNTCGSGSLFRLPAQTKNTSPYGKPAGFGTPVTSAVPVFNFKGISLFDLKNQPKKLRDEDSAANRKGGRISGAMGTGSPAQQISVSGGPVESISAFPLDGNQSKPLCGTTEVKRERETTENNEESAEVAVKSVSLDAKQQRSKIKFPINFHR